MTDTQLAKGQAIKADMEKAKKAIKFYEREQGTGLTINYDWVMEFKNCLDEQSYMLIRETLILYWENKLNRLKAELENL